MFLWFSLLLLLLLIARRLFLTSSLMTAMHGPQRKRFTVFAPKAEKPMVLFLIGTRLNSWWTLLLHFPKMLKFFRLAGKNFGEVGTPGPTHGCLAARAWGGPLDWFFGDGIMTVQYWRSFEELRAHNKNPNHNASRKQ